MQNVGLIAKQGYKYVFVLGLLLLLALVLGVCQILFFALFALCVYRRLFKQMEKGAKMQGVCSKENDRIVR